MEDCKFNFYECLSVAKRHGIEPLNLACANTAEWFIKYYCGVREDNWKYQDYINSVASSVKKTFLKFDEITFEDIEGYLMTLRDEEVIGKQLSINEVADNLYDYVSSDLYPEQFSDAKGEEMEM